MRPINASSQLRAQSAKIAELTREVERLNHCVARLTARLDSITARLNQIGGSSLTATEKAKPKGKSSELKNRITAAFSLLKNNYQDARAIRPAVPRGGMQAWIDELRGRGLAMPIAGADPEKLKGHFYASRGGGKRTHHAVDIMAPRRTPVLAVEDGRVARMNFNSLGGLTVYQVDPSEKFVYYYAHLDSYVPGMKAGDYVTKGQLIGYVGTTGNAPESCPHLHFSINRLAENGRLNGGAPIDPYLIFSQPPAVADGRRSKFNT
ncbi:MAG TPA: M23 family metallopeptidase [Candidatus Obscuribacterales bacterium]